MKTINLASTNEKPKRGFAALSPEQRREISRLGGLAVPAEKRTFSKDRQLAATAGKKGGKNVHNESRSFSKDRQLASEAGRKGGLAIKSNNDEQT